MSTFQSVASTYHTVSYCNLTNPTAISAIQLQSQESMIKFYLDLPLGVHIPECGKHPVHCFKLQSPQSDCNLSNHTAISAIRLQSQQSMIRFYHVVHIGVHIPECVKHPAHCFRLQSPQSDCNLSNQTAIPTIRLQYSQSMNRFYHVVHIGVHIPKCVKHPAHCLRLQSQQSDCNLHNQTAILLHCSWIAQIAVGLWRLQLDCGDCSLIAEIAVRLLRLQKFRNLHIQLVNPTACE